MRLAAIVLGLLALSACGGSSTASPEHVVKAWSAALDRNDNQAAGKLFAHGAQVIQNGKTTRLLPAGSAARWNALLPCGGEITSLQVRGKQLVLAVFKLTERPGHRCDAPGTETAALFEVQHGKIVVWQQTDVPTNASSTNIV